MRTKSKNGRRILPRKTVVFLEVLCLLLAFLLCAGFIARRLGGAGSGSGKIPRSLLELKEKYPETADFVDAYPEKKDQQYEIDLRGEVQPGEIPLFLQWDERWGYGTYGDDFLAVTGCGPTSLSMVVCGLTGQTQWDPRKVAEFAQEQGYYVKGEGSSWKLMTEGAEALGLTAIEGKPEESFILEHLRAGHPVICSMYPGDFTYSGHFIVLTGVDEQGMIKVNDCNSPKRSEKRWSMDVLLPQIHGLWAYTVDHGYTAVQIGV